MPFTSEYCFVRPNALVPRPSFEEEKEEESKTTEEGRQVFYQPTIIYTPVYTSSRVHQNQVSSGRTKLLTETDVDSLNKQLEALLIGNKEKEVETVEVKKDEVKKDEVKVSAQKELKTSVLLASKGMGRCLVKIGSDHDEKMAMRSCRLGAGKL